MAIIPLLVIAVLKMLLCLIPATGSKNKAGIMYIKPPKALITKHIMNKI